MKKTGFNEAVAAEVRNLIREMVTEALGSKTPKAKSKVKGAGKKTTGQADRWKKIAAWRKQNPTKTAKQANIWYKAQKAKAAKK